MVSIIAGKVVTAALFTICSEERKRLWLWLRDGGCRELLRPSSAVAPHSPFDPTPGTAERHVRAAAGFVKPPFADQDDHRSLDLHSDATLISSKRGASSKQRTPLWLSWLAYVD